MSDLEKRLLGLAEQWWPLHINGINGWDELARTLLTEAATIAADEERYACIKAIWEAVDRWSCTYDTDPDSSRYVSITADVECVAELASEAIRARGKDE